MKEESGVATHVRENDHFFNFDEAEVLVPCNDRRKRHIIESAIIKTQPNKVVNLNHGFSPNNILLSSYICNIFNQRSSIT